MDYLAYGQSWIEKKYEKAPDGSSGNGKIYHRFTSKEWDEETRLYSFPARYYEPRLARWMSVDPAGFELASPMERGQNGELQPKSGYSVIEALNHYSYVSNNPVKLVDPSGMYELEYDNQGNVTIQAEIENRQDLTDAVSTFYFIITGLPQGTHNIQFIDQDGNISGDYSSYSEALKRLLEEWPDEVILTVGIGIEVLNIGLFAGVGQKGPEFSISYLLASAAAYRGSNGNTKVDADVGFTLVAIPGLKIDFSLVNYTKNYYRKSFYKLFGNKR